MKKIDFAAYIPEDGPYIYDAIGNLVADEDEGVKISWTPYGKIREVKTKSDSVTVKFRYDGTGNRIEKRVEKYDTTLITRYVRDASGNVMTIYSDTTVIEQPIYGSSRLGMYKGSVLDGHQTLGRRSYELSNHLGNVLAVISDNIGMNTENTVWANVERSEDYYAFGMGMKERSYSAGSYRYGFNGKEKDDKGELGETHYDYGFRIYNPRIGKFLSVDPLTKSYPELTPYQFASNRPIDGIDLDGLEYYSIHLKIYVDGTGKVHRSLQKIVSHRDNEKGYGRKGPGLEYVITHQRHYANSNATYSFTVNDFKKNYHGIYVGPDNPRKTWQSPDQKGKFEDDYSLKPVDILDAAAKQHDLDYDKVNAAGKMDALFNEKTLSADIDLVQRSTAVIDMYKNKEIDPYTGKEVSVDTYKYALTVKKVFSAIAIEKVTPSGGLITTDDIEKKEKVKSELNKSKRD